MQGNKICCFFLNTVYIPNIQSGAEKCSTMQAANIIYVNCCSTMVSFLYNVDARDRIRRR